MIKKFPLWMLIPGCLMAAETLPPNAENQPCKENALTFFVDGSFTYWYAKEDGLDLARSGTIVGGGATVLLQNTEILESSFSYNPGFKVGLGIASPLEWCLHGEYTYYRATNKTNQAAPINDTRAIGPGVWNINHWFLQKTPIIGEDLPATYLSSKWHLGMDLGDLTLSHQFIKKKAFSCSPFGGLRTVWFRQTMSVDATQAQGAIGLSKYLPPQPISSFTQSHSWGIGPRLGAEGQYRFPFGIRLEGSIGGTLFYTKFTSVKHNEQRITLAEINETFYASLKNYNCVRPELDANLGIGWDMHFCSGYRIDLAASYDFSYFWGQNVMRNMLDEIAHGSSSGDNDLYFQGLTLSACFGF